jgi:hypothetical protein
VASAVDEARRSRLRARSESARREAIARRLADEPDADLAGRVRSLLDLPPDAAPDAIIEAASEDVLAWLTRALGTGAPRRRHLEVLSTDLRGRELARGEVERTFQRWLDGEDAPEDDDYVQIT